MSASSRDGAFDMNALLRGVQVGEQAAPSGEEVQRGSMSLDTYREMSTFTRAHEWENLTDDDRQAALREGIQPAHIQSVGGKADGGAGSEERSDTAGTGMNSVLRDALFENRGRGV